MFTKTLYTALFVAALASTAQADCLSDVQSVMKGMEAGDPYRIEMDMESGGVKTKMEGSVIMPHSFRMKGEGIEMVMNPNGVWMSQGGKLQKMPDAMREHMQGMIRQGMNIGLASIKEPECLGSASFEGGTYEHYRYNSDADFMGIKTNSKVDMYVDGDNRPAWMVVDGEAMGVKSLTRQKITYDSSITIADPQ